MASPAQQLASIQNSRLSTGPNTPEGKATASQNAITTGLFTARDFIREDEYEEYSEMSQSIYAQLSATGPIEAAYAAEIVSASWRLRRCEKLEISDEYTEAAERRIERARASAHNALRRSLAELRRLQTERQIRNEIYPEGTDLADLGLSDSRQIQKANAAETKSMTASARLKIQAFRAHLEEATAPASFCKTAPGVSEASASFCKTPSAPPNELKKVA